MGALTSKKNAFTFRSWEPKTFKEIDETEIKTFFIRTEHLKVKRTRILPINYWMADKKRFSEQKNTQNYPLLVFTGIRLFSLNQKIKEVKNTQYLISNIEAYKKIIEKIADKTISNISCFFAKRIPMNSPAKISFLGDIITNQKVSYRNGLENFEDIIGIKNILLLTNPRLESPAFNAFLHKNTEEFNFISISSFSSNLIKEEIPLSVSNIQKMVKGYYDLNSTVVVNSALNIIPDIRSIKTITLKPLYMNTKGSEYNKEERCDVIFLNFQKDRKTYKPSFLSTQYINGMIDIYLPSNTFDSFVQKKISYKVYDRIFLLINVLNLGLRIQKYNIKNNTNNNQNALSILFQTIKTI